MISVGYSLSGMQSYASYMVFILNLPIMPVSVPAEFDLLVNPVVDGVICNLTHVFSYVVA